MKLKPRKAEKTIAAIRITAPETRKDPTTNERIPLLGFIDTRGNQQHLATHRALFLYAAGDNLDGQIPDGLDRLSHHQFIVHVDKGGDAIGLDIIPARVYRSNVIPASQKDVTTVQVAWHAEGSVCRVMQRPPNTRPQQLTALLKGLEKLAIAGTKLVTGVKIPDVGVIAGVGLDTIEVKMNASRSGGRPIYDVDPDGDGDD